MTGSFFLDNKHPGGDGTGENSNNGWNYLFYRNRITINVFMTDWSKMAISKYFMYSMPFMMWIIS